MIISSSALARTIETTAIALGTDLPGHYVAELDSARKVVTESGELDGHVGSLNAAAVTAIREGRDVGTDPNVQRFAALVALSGSGIRHFAVDYANDIIATAIAAQADTILTSWSTAITADCAALQAAAEQLHVPKLDGAEPLLLKRAGHLNLWADAVSAAERADIALGGVRAILSALNINPGPEYRVLQLAPDATVDQFVGANAATGPRDLNAWSAARSLAPLRLVTSVTEFTGAAARITAERQEQQRRADDAEAEQTQGRQRQRKWVRAT